jgi:uncharacterized protein YndB with AHSA1/START domain
MGVTHVEKDPAARTLTITAEFVAAPDQVWRVWADPRRLERWWGPPTYPATVMEHGLTPGGRVTYVMTGPEGDTYRGWWQVLAVDAPHGLEFEDGFADEVGHPDPDLPTMTIRVALERAADAGTRMRIRSSFPTAEAMDQLLAMGMEEGLTAALGQIDNLLTARIL